MVDLAHERLEGPGAGREVLRFGREVHRPHTASSRTTARLLHYLKSRDFAYSPRFLGVSPEGRDILTFIPGVDGRSVQQSDTVLERVARLLRRYHDIVRDYQHDEAMPVVKAVPSGASSIVCHNDFAPYNTVFRDDEPVGIIDWDLICYAPPLWDVTNAAWSFVPLYSPEDCAWLGLSDARQAERLAIFCAAYGTGEADEVLPVLKYRLQAKVSPLATRSLSLLEQNARSWGNHLRSALRRT